MSIFLNSIYSSLLRHFNFTYFDIWANEIKLCMSSNRILEYINIVPRAMDELPIEQSRSQPVNPSHVTINGLSHYCTHNASVNNSI